MATIEINGSALGNALCQVLTAPDIQPGDQPSYQTCKTIWVFHPIGAKMVEAPIAMAQCQEREISVPGPGEDEVRKAFEDEWKAIGADQNIYNTMATSRAYGIASIAAMSEKFMDPSKPLPFKDLAGIPISFNTLDPLNTAGSLVLNQDPNSIDFQKVVAMSVGNGQPFHRTRYVTVMNERPVYIEYTSSGFGFVGRSVFQRALFPLKSFVQTMVTDDLVTKKAGVFIAKIESPSSAINEVMGRIGALKRLFVKESTNGNVIQIGVAEAIETLNMTNIDGAYGLARKNILDNIAVAGDMPAEILNSETFAEGFGEGSEDAKRVARWVDRFRVSMAPLYDFFTNIVQHRAWSPEFFGEMQIKFPEYRRMKYDQAFMQWRNAFAAQWPSLLTEPDSEKVKTEDVKLKALIAFLEVIMPAVPQEVKAELIQTAQDNINENKMMFKHPFSLDIQAIADYEPPVDAGMEGGPQEPKPPKPFKDSEVDPRIMAAVRGRIRQSEALDRSVSDLVAKLAAAGAGAPSSKLNGHAKR